MYSWFSLHDSNQDNNDNILKMIDVVGPEEMKNVSTCISYRRGENNNKKNLIPWVSKI